MQTLHFEIEIAAPRDRVWEVLWHDEFFRDWAGTFTGSRDRAPRLVTDWLEGSRFEFFEGDSGSYGVIEQVTPHEVVSFKHQGEIRAGRDEPFGDGARREIYRLRHDEGKTWLTLDQDVPDEFVRMFEDATPRAFERIRELAEMDR